MNTINQAYELFHQGSLALAEAEAGGVRIDVEYLNQQVPLLEQEIQGLKTKLEHNEIYTTWCNEYKEKSNIGSNEQLGHILFDILKIPYPYEKTRTGRYSTTAAVLEEVDLPFAHDWVKMKDLEKDKSTFFEGIRSEVVDGYLHPFWHLASGEGEKGGARSYRSSSSSPNLQNIPNREPNRAGRIRKSFLPDSDEYYFGEIDFKAAEVAAASIVTQDGNLMSYASDPERDMHRDTAQKLFSISAKDAKIKKIRNIAKGPFVFAQFYGDYYVKCARNIWKHIEDEKPVLSDGTPLFDHLRKNGIKELGKCKPEFKPEPGTLEHRVKEVERYFWYEMFSVYTAWKKFRWQEYQNTGKFDYLTGFSVRGEYRKNQILNYPIQGLAFHCLLWTLIQLHRWLKRNKMKSRIIGQIHDSIILCIHRLEIQDVLTKVKELVRVNLPNTWTWMNVPLTVEVEIAPLGKPWWNKKSWVESSGKWGPESE